MEIVKGKYGSINVEGGDVVARAPLGTLVKSKIADLKAKVQSGEIDLVKGTDIDATVALTVLDLIEAQVDKI